MGQTLPVIHPGNAIQECHLLGPGRAAVGAPGGAQAQTLFERKATMTVEKRTLKSSKAKQASLSGQASLIKFIMLMLKSRRALLHLRQLKGHGFIDISCGKRKLVPHHTGTLNVVITALPRDIGGRNDSNRHPWVCKRKQGNKPLELVDRDREKNRSPAIQEKTVSDLLSCLDPHKAMRLDGIPLKVLKGLVEEQKTLPSHSPSVIISPG
ncbi:hypothetical protein DUI87_18017 [Hirundo rustica rustica]|uniref:Uncharacterized protein n=1 Tax=Hirundo rustica rustica TaxID=333673 RepID=A0A3M0JUY0_HIRRU|nr:hypothetical protein DUI87_18017 [Hirundo rustica rustica]